MKEKCNRRQFLGYAGIGSIMTSGLLMPGCKGKESALEKEAHKFLENSGMSFQEVYDFVFKDFYIPIMKNLANEIGKEEFIEMLKKARSELGKQQGQDMAKSLGKNDMASLVAFLKDNVLSNNAFTDEIVEETDQAFAANTTECLYAKTFREADASDIGYASICHGDYAWTSAFNPEMKMIRTKTLMQGHDYCNHRTVLEAYVP